MQLLDIATRVRAKCDDPDGTYITDDYVMGFAQDAYEWLYNKLRLINSDFDEQIVVLPAVGAGVPDLNSFQAPGQALVGLVQPRMVRWRLPGQDDSFFRRADGPLDYIRDIGNAIPQLDSWAWIKYSIKLSKFSTPLDLEVTGEFLFDSLTAPDSQIQIGQNVNRCFASKIASEVGKARGNDKWVTTYGDDADEAYDDIKLAMARARQAVPERLGRISRQSQSGQRLNTR